MPNLRLSKVERPIGWATRPSPGCARTTRLRRKRPSHPEPMAHKSPRTDEPIKICEREDPLSPPPLSTAKALGFLLKSHYLADEFPSVVTTTKFCGLLRHQLRSIAFNRCIALTAHNPRETLSTPGAGARQWPEWGTRTRSRRGGEMPAIPRVSRPSLARAPKGGRRRFRPFAGPRKTPRSDRTQLQRGSGARCAHRAAEANRVTTCILSATFLP